MSSLPIVLAGFGVVSAAGIAAGAWSVRLRRDRPVVPVVHATRDDHARDPLAVPLRTGCASFEIGVWLDTAERLQVGAAKWDRDAGNAIGPSVLQPLALRAERLGGQVAAGQRSPVLLMIEILETEPIRQARAYEVLDGALRAHPDLLTHMRDGIVTPGPVTAVLTGTGVPRHMLAAQFDRYAFVDGNAGDVGAWGAPAALVPVVSEHWSWRFGWDGVDEMPVEERHLLREIVRSAHADGRLVRFFGLPERPVRLREAFWHELIAAGVDLISVSEPAALARYVRGRDEASTPREHDPTEAGR